MPHRHRHAVPRQARRLRVGLDFSPKAIAAARLLRREADLDAPLVEGNVYDARLLINGLFDMVYVTWGAILVSDLGRWAGVAASLLKPGGRLYLLEGHPSFMQLDEKAAELRIGFDWHNPPDKPLTMSEGIDLYRRHREDRPPGDA